mmetsp:Transcript_32910/g.78088  ORF Transcript_32910/g.78088 Transcript_32910/m.78088 type:complete len:149 (+) Transcript_32910:94-540(+)
MARYHAAKFLVFILFCLLTFSILTPTSGEVSTVHQTLSRGQATGENRKLLARQAPKLQKPEKSDEEEGEVEDDGEDEDEAAEAEGEEGDEEDGEGDLEEEEEADDGEAADEGEAGEASFALLLSLFANRQQDFGLTSIHTCCLSVLSV